MVSTVPPGYQTCGKWLLGSAIEFSDTSASSEGWHVQWESVPPGQESEAP